VDRKANLIWSIADIRRGTKPHKYGRFENEYIENNRPCITNEVSN